MSSPTGNHPTERPNPTPLQIATSVHLPTFLFTAGQGAIVPILPLIATDLGASVALAGVLVSLRGFGTMAADLPAGVWVARLGERRTMMAASGILVVVGVGVSFQPHLSILGLLVFLMGCAWAVFNLARITYITEVVPNHRRGRMMSTLGATQRAGAVVGPAIGGVAIHLFGLVGAFYVQAVMGVAAVICIYLQMDTTPDSTSSIKWGEIRDLVRRSQRALLTAGVAVAALQVVRSARDVALPLWADSMGVTPTQISVIFTAMFIVDMAVFYPVGLAMDTIGRRAVYLSSTFLLSVGLALLPLTHSLGAITIVALLTGFGNGLGSGINLTLSSDLAPQKERSEFLGLFRLVTDTGIGIGPLMVGALVAVAGIPAALVATSAVGGVGIAIFAFSVPETLDKQDG